MNEYDKDCKTIVMEYLLHYCYKDTAKSLLAEINNLDNCMNSIGVTDSKEKTKSKLEEKGIDWDQIDARREISKAIKEGDIGKAFTLIENSFPQLIRTYNTINRMDSLSSNNFPTPLPKSHLVLFKLRCQQFIETLRTSGDLQAIQFAQYYLRPCSKIYTDLTNSVTTLIAYRDLEHENTKHLLSQERRDTIADEVNEMLLDSQHFSAQTSLEKLWRQKAAIQVELDNQKRNEMLKDQKETDNGDKMPM